MARVDGFSPKIRKTHTGFRIGSTVQINDAESADVARIPLEKAVYAKPKNIPIKATAIHSTLLKFFTAGSVTKKGSKKTCSRQPKKEACCGFAFGKRLARNTPAKVIPDKRLSKSPTNAPCPIWSIKKSRMPERVKNTVIISVLVILVFKNTAE